MSDSTTGHRPTATEMAAARVLLAPSLLLTSPVFYGVERASTDRGPRRG